MFKINEHFLAIQGEGKEVGAPALFLRLRRTLATEIAVDEPLAVVASIIQDVLAFWRYKRVIRASAVIAVTPPKRPRLSICIAIGNTVAVDKRVPGTAPFAFTS